MSGKLSLPIIDLSSSDRASTAKSVRQACLDYGFFYTINHGIDKELLQKVFDESKKFFSLPLDDKMKLEHNKDHRGYTPMYAETLDPSSKFRGDLKESFYIGSAGRSNLLVDPNLWPSEEILPSWRATMEIYREKVLNGGTKILNLIALALNLDGQFFEKIGALNDPAIFIRLLHYPGELTVADNGNYGASAHSDYGMVTLLATDGVPGLQICREKDREPQLWEDVHHVDGYQGAYAKGIGTLPSKEQWTCKQECVVGPPNTKRPRGRPRKERIRGDEEGRKGQVSKRVHKCTRCGGWGHHRTNCKNPIKNHEQSTRAIIVNIGDMMERWTNCLFRSTLHRVLATGKERYSVAFFLDPNSDCVVECLESCCSEMSPPKFPPIRSGDYLEERLRITYTA